MKSSKIWEYSEDDEIVGCRPIGPLDEPVPDDQFYKIFHNDQPDPKKVEIDIFGDSPDGWITVRHFFLRRSDSDKDLERFWERCKDASVILHFTKRWGEVRIQWGGPGYKKTQCAAELVAYFDDGGDIWLDRNYPVGSRFTFRELFADCQHLEDLAQKLLLETGPT